MFSANYCMTLFRLHRLIEMGSRFYDIIQPSFYPSLNHSSHVLQHVYLVQEEPW